MADPMAFWNGLASRTTHTGVTHTSEALQKYQMAFFSRDTVHAVSTFCVNRESGSSSVYALTAPLPDMRGLSGVCDH